MRTIDIHAHLTPQRYLQAKANGKDWHGLEIGDVRNEAKWNPEQRIVDMDSLGVDVQVISTTTAFYCYDLDVATTTAIAQECNDEVCEMVTDYPTRFAGFCTLPMQDINAAISELERGMVKLGLKGAMIDDHVNGRTFEDPQFLPFWKAVEQMGAVIFVHQRGGQIMPRMEHYHLSNTIGNLVERVTTFASLVFGGVMDKFPNLKICLAHGGGYTCYGLGRMDRGWEVRSEARMNIKQPPSTYAKRFYYDCITHSEPALRMLIDTVGADRVVLGTDWPADMRIDWPIAWILNLKSLGQQEKDMILGKNLEKLLGL
jgi:aminocarboxymuconate-semialdehyde decarboxylase